MPRYITCVETKRTYIEYAFVDSESDTKEISEAAVLAHVRQNGIPPEHIVRVCQTKRPRYKINKMQESVKPVEENYENPRELAEELYGSDVFVTGILSGATFDALEIEDDEEENDEEVDESDKEDSEEQNANTY